jgi:hypothetical protein
VTRGEREALGAIVRAIMTLPLSLDLIDRIGST